MFALPCPTTITLTSGQLVIDKSVAIIGPGARCLTINGNAAGRVFIITVGGTNVGISGMTITNGRATSGGGIQNNGANLTLTAVNITATTASLASAAASTTRSAGC